MSGCPAYLGVVINNRLELDELFRYDLLILCPSDFNLTFKVNTTALYYQPTTTTTTTTNITIITATIYSR